uniref:Uncharacterized protein n=1 Tax=Knipowitschia caucasica TaxID=637954 RepID=A0AAV2K9B8_KNICA
MTEVLAPLASDVCPLSVELIQIHGVCACATQSAGIGYSQSFGECTEAAAKFWLVVKLLPQDPWTWTVTSSEQGTPEDCLLHSWA